MYDNNDNNKRLYLKVRGSTGSISFSILKFQFLFRPPHTQLGWTLQVIWSLFIFFYGPLVVILFFFSSFFFHFLFVFLYCYHVQLDSLTQGACATIRHTDVGQRERHVSLRRHFSMILSSTHISSQGFGLPGEQVFRHILKCAEQRGWTPDLRVTSFYFDISPLKPNYWFF